MILLGLILLVILWVTREKPVKKTPVTINEGVRINTLLQNIENYDGTDRCQTRLEDIK